MEPQPDKLTTDGRQRFMRHGICQGMTGIGPMAVRYPCVA
jgi:hypothetical protein